MGLLTRQVEGVLRQPNALHHSSGRFQDCWRLIHTPHYVAQLKGSPLLRGCNGCVVTFLRDLRPRFWPTVQLFQALGVHRPDMSRLGTPSNHVYREGSIDVLQSLRWEVHAVFACISEVGVLVAPLWLVWDLQKPIAAKAGVVGPFALRLLYV